VRFPTRLISPKPGALEQLVRNAFPSQEEGGVATPWLLRGALVAHTTAWAIRRHAERIYRALRELLTLSLILLHSDGGKEVREVVTTLTSHLGRVSRLYACTARCGASAWGGGQLWQGCFVTSSVLSSLSTFLFQFLISCFRFLSLSHHITSHHSTSRHITSHHITSSHSALRTVAHPITPFSRRCIQKKSRTLIFLSSIVCFH
jgi:hypothetical protein